MSWQRILQSKSRDPAFLWRMVIAIIGVGIVLGWVFDSWAAKPLARLANPDNERHWDQLESWANAGEWVQLWWGIPRTMLSGFETPGIVALATFAGCCWLTFLWQVLRIHRPWDWRLPVTLIAVGLGILSIWPTRFLIYWQEVEWGLHENMELVPGLRFFILGVGLREELAKMICLLPLMPILLRRRDEMLALVCSACVGLGFAIVENINYFIATQATSTMGRFLTANPAHMALTGLIGLNVYRAFRDPKNWGPQALAMFGLMVFAHGLYDAAIVLPALADISLAGSIIFAFVLYQFFHELRTLRSPGRDTISLSATFLFVVSLLTATTFIYVSSIVGAQSAADSLVFDVVSLSIMVYLFLREMPETLVGV
jgi:RsiW-degrading membrane proteinase PrsW (M82 family)